MPPLAFYLYIRMQVSTQVTNVLYSGSTFGTCGRFLRSLGLIVVTDGYDTVSLGLGQLADLNDNLTYFTFSRAVVATTVMSWMT